MVASIFATASPTVLIFSASSSGMSILNSVSNAMTSSTWSSESAPQVLGDRSLGRYLGLIDAELLDDDLFDLIEGRCIS